MFSGAQPRPKSWGRPGFGSQHRGACAPRPDKGRAGCWIREGVAPSCCEGPGLSPPENFLKTQMINPAFWWVLAVKCLAFWKLWPRSWGNNTLLVPQPKSWRISLPRSLRLLRLWMFLWSRLSRALIVQTSPPHHYFVSYYLLTKASAQWRAAVPSHTGGSYQ